MGIAITDEHLELARVAEAFTSRCNVRAVARNRLDSTERGRPAFWADLLKLGWLGLPAPERFGGSGYGLAEVAVVAEALGAAVAPGPFLPTVAAVAVLSTCGSDEDQARWLPSLIAGTTTSAVGIADGIVLGGHEAELLLLVLDDDVLVWEVASDAVRVDPLEDIDPSRRSAVVRPHGPPVGVLGGAARRAVAILQVLLAAEAAGVATECCRASTAYAKDRIQFGRPIGTYQAVKHHCADMLVASELASAAVWDAARAVDGDDLEQLELASAIAATLAGPAALENAHLNIQVHGGIGYTWEHDAHLLLRRAIAVAAVLEGLVPHTQIVAATRAGVARPHHLDLGPDAEGFRAEIRAFADEVARLEPPAARDELISSGYVMPHWPRPWGRGASPVVQLVIEEEFRKAGIERPDYRVAAWVIPSLVQHGTPNQIERWVRPALHLEQIWCQLFSEPEAGSDAAGIRTRGERVDGGWRVTGQKVWTSDSAEAHLGLATVRTNRDAPKHRGITTMVVDMHADGVEVRPLRQVDGDSEFSEVFLTDVFVPDDDVVGVVDGGWAVARSTLGNERVSIGGGAGDSLGVSWDWARLLDLDPNRSVTVERDVAEVLATDRGLALLNLRQAARAVAGGEPGPEANITKLVAAELSHRRGFVALRLVGAAAASTEGDGACASLTNLRTRAMSIAGGTSEITRNQIGERLLGLPRDPLLS